MKIMLQTFFLSLVFRMLVCEFLEAQSVFISIQPFEYTTGEQKLTEDIIYLFETQFRKTPLVALVPKEQETEIMDQDQYLLDGSIRIKPIRLRDMYGKYKVIRGHLGLFPEHYTLSAEMVDKNTGALEYSFQFKGSLHDVRTLGVDQMVIEFSSRLAKLGL